VSAAVPTAYGNRRVPRGRRAEDGPVPERYPNLRETETDDYEMRTRLNVQDADATVILSQGPGSHLS
jgi:Circularly permutated YpsA SLOG family